MSVAASSATSGETPRWESWWPSGRGRGWVSSRNVSFWGTVLAGHPPPRGRTGGVGPPGGGSARPLQKEHDAAGRRHDETEAVATQRLREQDEAADEQRAPDAGRRAAGGARGPPAPALPGGTERGRRLGRRAAASRDGPGCPARGDRTAARAAGGRRLCRARGAAAIASRTGCGARRRAWRRGRRARANGIRPADAAAARSARGVTAAMRGVTGARSGR